ncbi:MAG: hypothetical protein HY270_19040 [Deltaproteobacteria bacterium]|nr:hypothetical protein [Deltaproteobacteria bacterium]
MKTFRIAVVTLLVAAPVYAGPPDTIVFFHAPILGEAGLLGLAVMAGLAGIRLIDRYKK